ncbi:MAG: DUF502 domain-containing protein [Candidatus Neomarinimicrobiota bacterium]
MVKKIKRKKPGRLLRYKFLTGLLTLLPIYVTYLLIRFIVGIAPNIPYLKTIPFFSDNEALASILEFLVALLVIIFIGVIVGNVVGKRLFAFFERFMEKLPLVNIIYTSSRQIMQTLTMPGKGNFKQVVLLEYPRKELWTLAFVTAYSKSKSGEQYVHIFLPTTPNPTSGFMLFVKEKDVRPSGLTIEEGLKTLISGGMISSEKNQLP